MLNLESLGLVELNAQEVKETEGGLWAEIAVVAAFCCPLGLGVGIFALGVYNGYHSQP